MASPLAEEIQRAPGQAEAVHMQKIFTPKTSKVRRRNNFETFLLAGLGGTAGLEESAG